MEHVFHSKSKCPGFQKKNFKFPKCLELEHVHLVNIERILEHTYTSKTYKQPHIDNTIYDLQTINT